MPKIKRKENGDTYNVENLIAKDGVIIPENTKTAKQLRRIVSGDNADSLSKKFEWNTSEIKTKPKVIPKAKKNNKKKKTKKGKK